MESASATPRIPKSTPRSRRGGGGGGGVRVVGKVRPCAGSGGAGFCARVRRADGEHAAVSFADRSTGVPRKETCKLDWCYEEDEDIPEIFVKEVKPLIHGLFEGSNACVIAYGARGSGKTQLIRGSEQDTGLAPMAMSEVLELAKSIGGTVSISSYEVRQDHIFDLFEPKEQEVLLLEDGDRKIQLKGLSKVIVHSIEEFAKLYSRGCNQEKLPDKAANEPPIRGHQGLIVYVSGLDKQGEESFLAKMNFLDLAGYEDAKPKSNGRFALAEGAKINKSLYALMNVVYALNNNEVFVPYRESKLTRILQDFLCKTGGAVLIACLGQISCQDEIHAVNLASRSSQVVSRHRYSLSTNSKSNLTSTPSSIHRPDNLIKQQEQAQVIRSAGKATQTSSVLSKRPHPLVRSMKKPGTLISSSAGTKVAISGRKLFDPSTDSSKEDASNALLTIVAPSEEVQSLVEKEIEPRLADKVIPDNVNDEASCTMQEADRTLHDHADCSITDVGEISSTYASDNLVEQIPVSTAQSSPKLSEKLREISNSLKLLSTKPISITEPKVDISAEPKTPGVPFSSEQAGTTPNDAFKARSTGIKKSLVRECLTFLNSASKEQLKELKGIGDKRANYILQLREDSPEPFKEIDDLKDIGLSAKQIEKMVSRIIEDA